MTRRALRASALVGIMVVAVGCGSGQTEQQAVSAPTPEGSHGEGHGAGAYDADDESPAAAGVTSPGNVKVVDYTFSPAETTVRAGESVTWTFVDEDGHDVTATDQSFVSDVLASGGTYSFTFPRAGTFEYFCSLHPSMKGVVVVQ